MRRRLAVGLGAVGLVLAGVPVPEAVAQVPPPSGELLPGGAGVTAGYHVFNGGDPEVAPGGANSDRECWYEHDSGAGQGSEAGLGALQAALAAQQAAGGGDKLSVQLICQDIGGGNETSTSVDWPPDGNPGFLVAPLTLAQWAHDQLWYPPPVGDMSPSIGSGTFAQLATYFWVGNWAAVSASASAGPVTSTATATPVSQTWEVRDTLRDTTYSFSCAGAGVAFDGSSGAPPPAGACTWTPEHSSAGQGETHTATGEACFPATVTVTWDIEWTVTGAAGGGSLGTDQSAASTCIFVDEIQALVTDG